MGWTDRKREQGWKGAIIGPSEWPQIPDDDGKQRWGVGDGADGGTGYLLGGPSTLADYCLRPPI
jgi:hypothetical protein